MKRGIIGYTESQVNRAARDMENWLTNYFPLEASS